MQGIVYVLMANDKSATPIGEVSLARGNFHTIALRVLEKCKTEDRGFQSFTYNQTYLFHCYRAEFLTVLCMSDSQYSSHKSYQFLLAIHQKLLDTFGESLKEAIGFSIKGEFLKEIRGKILEFNSEYDQNKILVAQRHVDEVKDIMVQNIEKVIERGEKIDLLVVKSHELESGANIFRRDAGKIKMHFCWENTKYALIVLLALLLIMGIIILVSCGGFDFDLCSHSL